MYSVRVSRTTNLISPVAFNLSNLCMLGHGHDTARRFRPRHRSSDALLLPWPLFISAPPFTAYAANFPFFIVPSLMDKKMAGPFSLQIYSDVGIVIQMLDDEARKL